MAGKLIVLPGVSSGVGGGRIDMTDADLIAARMPYLTNVVSARTLRAGASGVSGRCRASGGLLTTTGASVSSMTITSLVGRPAIALTDPSAAAALLLPKGSWSNEFCVVAAVFVDPDLSLTTRLRNIISAMNDTAYAGSPVRMYGDDGGANAKHAVNTMSGAGTNSAKLLASGFSGKWVIMMASLDAVGKSWISINGGEPSVASAVNAVRPSNEAEARMVVGYTTHSGLNDSGVGDLFVFNKSLHDSEFERNVLGNLIVALKAQYGIA